MVFASDMLIAILYSAIQRRSKHFNHHWQKELGNPTQNRIDTINTAYQPKVPGLETLSLALLPPLAGTMA
jgi:hypothetical protein